MSEGVVDILRDIKDAVTNRLANPLVGSFMVSWIVWNFRALFVLLSSRDVEWKLKYLDETLYPTWERAAFLIFGGPFISSLTYIFVLPPLAAVIHRWVQTRHRVLSEISKQVNDGGVLGLKESIQIRRSEQDAVDALEKISALLDQERLDNQGRMYRKDVELKTARNSLLRAQAVAAPQLVDFQDRQQAISEYLKSREMFFVRWDEVGGFNRIRFLPSDVISSDISFPFDSWKVIGTSLRLSNLSEKKALKFEFAPAQVVFFLLVNDKPQFALSEDFSAIDRWKSEWFDQRAREEKEREFKKDLAKEEGT